MMALDHSLKSLAFADANYVYKLFTIEQLDQDTIAGLHRGIAISLNWHFAHEFHRRQIVLAQVPTHRTRQPRLFHEFNQTNLSGIVSVFGLRFVLSDHAGARLQHGRRAHIALRIEELRHPDFLSQNSCYLCHFLIPVWRGRPRPRKRCGALLRLTAEGGCPYITYLCSLPNALISTSTPAGRSSFISASTVCGVGSRMSSKRLCVRISNCSRDFLSTCGERSTQYLFFIVGSGIGPAICAPVRRAVSTISPVDWSRMR